MEKTVQDKSNQLTKTIQDQADNQSKMMFAVQKSNERVQELEKKVGL